MTTIIYNKEKITIIFNHHSTKYNEKKITTLKITIIITKTKNYYNKSKRINNLKIIK